jgi:hypothetical protein
MASTAQKNRLMLTVIVVAAIGLGAFYYLTRSDESSSPATPPPQQLQTQPTQAQGRIQQPPGPAPEGKVWSPEHGHWHDAPGTTPASTPGQLTPQPPGPAPEGKVWVPEHGHWHDAPKTKVVGEDKANQPDSQ